MKFKFIYTLLSLSLLAFIFMSHEAGRAADQGEGNTGAPGDQTFGGNPRTCISCHGGDGSIQTVISIVVLDETDTPITEYIPGQTYRVRVSHDVAVGNPVGYGFQALCLTAPLDQEGDDAAGFSNPASNVQIAVADNGRQYAEQNGMSDSEVFEVDWTAPIAGTGTVTFYTCGNAVNDDNTNSGDGADCETLELTEGDPSSTSEPEDLVLIYLFPNPVEDRMQVMLDSPVPAVFNMEIFDMSGRLMLEHEIGFVSGESVFLFDVNRLSTGTYIVKFSNGDNIATGKLLKL